MHLEIITSKLKWCVFLMYTLNNIPVERKITIEHKYILFLEDMQVDLKCFDAKYETFRTVQAQVTCSRFEIESFKGQNWFVDELFFLVNYV